MADNHRSNAEKGHQKRDYIVFFIVAFVLIFLTSSFVIENIYDSADKLVVSPQGVKEIYLSVIGHESFEDQIMNRQDEEETQKDSSETEKNEEQKTTTDQSKEQQ